MLFLERHWQRRTVVSALLAPLAALFSTITAARRTAFASGLIAREKLPVPVVVVGNVTVGGSGKTPLVLWLAQALKARAFAPGIVSRGYGGTASLSEVTADSDPQRVGDEPVLLAARSGCPVWIGRSRVTAARALVARHPEVDVLISDDGLQHYRLARDVEIAVVDGARGFGNRWLLPAGPLREPISRLSSVAAVVVNDGTIAQVPVPVFDMRLQGRQLRNLLNPERTADAGILRGKNVHAVAGIGNPQQFFLHLQRLGISFTAHAFPDHHSFKAEELDFPGAGAVIMTEKDAIKCSRFARASWWLLPVDASIDPALADLVVQRISTRRGH
ncbi:MAG: tetraacyldisaccharide 4'-kinase [Burkholderiales bacterium]